MGDITHPTLLLLLLRLKRLPALNQHQKPFVGTRQNDGFQWLTTKLPFAALWPLQMAGADDGFIQLWNRQHIVQRLAPHQPIARQPQQPLGSVVDVGDPEVRTQHHPTLVSGIDPGQ